jgi:hypothetical protein
MQERAPMLSSWKKVEITFSRLEELLDADSRPILPKGYNAVHDWLDIYWAGLTL